MIEIHLLEALAAFYQYGTLSAAAMHLHISQPALSRSMKRLEEILNVSLFTRTKNSISLNDTGILAAQLAQDILNSENRMIQMVRYYDSSLHTISIGSEAPGPIMEIPSLMTQLYPDMSITCETENEENLLQGLEDQKYNIIILSHPMDIPNIECLPYSTESLYVSIPSDHALKKFKDTGVTFEDIDGNTFLQISYVGVWDEIKKKMLPNSKILRQSDRESLNALENASSLLSFATDVSLRSIRERNNPNRILIPIIDPEATVQFYCLMKKDKRLNPFIQYLQTSNK
jgi:DNA-binding transcriptional LysR family regulator